MIRCAKLKKGKNFEFLIKGVKSNLKSIGGSFGPVEAIFDLKMSKIDDVDVGNNDLKIKT